ncbi:MAG TPA: hypothetical protein VFX48_08485 [Saprospiraceae bacterium]|nr:hypothetical protein [Saprospiraceae bacterium]
MIDQPNIVYLLLWHLNRYHWFDLPGIGLFTAEKQASFVDHINHKIHPGRIELQFLPGGKKDVDKMLDQLVEETGYERQRLNDHLNALVHFIREGLQKTGSFEFKPFGSFIKTEKGLQWKSGTTNLHQDFYGREALPIQPVVRSYIKPETVSAPIRLPNTAKKNTELKALMFASAILGILALLLFCWPDSCTRKPSSGSTGVQRPDSAIMNTPDTTSPGMKGFVDTMTYQPSATTDSLQREVVVDSTNIDSLNQAIKFKPCVIIVGSFIKISNANRMEKRIIADGYKPFRERYGSFNRTGITFNCFTHDLQQMLEQLKKDYHPDAWVLKF